ncbi:MAG: tripartite tricarboxylate transporter TctB family protein [Acidiferrobacterales bacterium]
MKKLTTRQWLEVAFWLVFAGLAYVFSFNFSRDIEMYKFGAAGWPRVLIFLIVAAAIGQLVQLLLGREVEARGVVADAQSSTTDVTGRHDMASIIRMGLTLALPIVYASLLNYTGYYFTTPLFLAGYLYLIGERRVKWLVFVPIAIWVVLTILFTRFLYVGLPVGYWPGFYDFSNWLIVLIR